MYKDKNKQRQAQKQWIAEKRLKAKLKSIQDASQSTKSVEPDTIIPPVEPVLSNPDNIEPVEPLKGFTTLEGEVNRVSLPGDADYIGVITDNWRQAHNQPKEIRI